MITNQLCERCMAPKARRRGRYCNGCALIAYRENNKEKLAAKAREVYARDPDPAKMRAKLWIQKNPDARSAKGKRAYRANPNKKKAQVAVFRAVRRGELVRLPCAICGALNTEAHHFSYDREHWLHVLWLCVGHHDEAHKGLWPQIKIPTEL